jgi:hypothetical protein
VYSQHSRHLANRSRRSTLSAASVQYAIGARDFSRSETIRRTLIAQALFSYGPRPYRYKRFISDIGGQDIKAHCTRPVNAIRHVRDWLQSAPGKAAIPGGTKISQDYQRFRRELPVIAEEAQLDPAQLTFIDYLQLVTNWLKLHR